MTMRPTANRILVKPIAEDLMTKGGILLPNAVDKPAKYAEIISVGPKVLDFKIGDVIIFNKYVGVEAEDGCLILKDEDILAILTETDNI
jgi:chaperonin GroES